MAIPNRVIRKFIIKSIAAMLFILLVQGDSLSVDLLTVQLQLKQLGYDPGPLNGEWNSKTISALNTFQKNIKLTPYGKVDYTTIYALFNPRTVLMCRRINVPMRNCIEYFIERATNSSVGGSNGSPSDTNSKCDDAYRKCKRECDNQIYDYEGSRYLDASDTDFIGHCEDACKRGKRYCENEDDVNDKCDEFRRKCNGECPSMVYLNSESRYLSNTNANSCCEDACRAGYRECN